jgi:invasion protein IalB
MFRISIGANARLFVALLGATLLTVAAAAAEKSVPTPPLPPTSPGQAAQPAAAAGPQASTSTATFDDWVVRCETRPPAPKVCEAAQTIAARGPNQQQSVIAEVVFGRVGKSDPMKLIVQLPPGVWLPGGASFTIGEGTNVALVYTRCTQACIAEAELKPEFIQTLRGWTKTDPARLEFDDGAQHKVALNVSLKGLPAALAARDEQSTQ